MKEGFKVGDRVSAEVFGSRSWTVHNKEILQAEVQIKRGTVRHMLDGAVLVECDDKTIEVVSPRQCRRLKRRERRKLSLWKDASGDRHSAVGTFWDDLRPGERVNFIECRKPGAK